MNTSHKNSSAKRLPTPTVRDLQPQFRQGSLFESVDVRFEGDAPRRARAELALLVSCQTRYPAAPPVIRKAWEALVPAILELSFHQSHEHLTLAQSVRRTRNLSGTGNRVIDPTVFKHKPKVLDTWLLDVLIPLGTIPTEICDSTDRFVVAGASRLKAASEEPDDGGISIAGRNEALMCLELLCSKVWYARNVERRPEMHIKASLFAALQFLYWECGIPSSLSMLWDEPPELTSRVYDEVRRFNFRQLYAVEKAHLLPELFDRVREGIEAMQERRQFFAQRFSLALRRDPRWHRSFSEHSAVIMTKYARDTDNSNPESANRCADFQD